MELIGVMLQSQDVERLLGLQKSDAVSNDVECEQGRRTRDDSLDVSDVRVL